jgi:site-specific recombinase XerD
VRELRFREEPAELGVSSDSRTKVHYCELAFSLGELLALLAATGLRVGEALGLKVSDFGPDCRVLHISRSIWRGRHRSQRLQILFE